MISVIIPMYNSEKTILKVLESVKNQTIGKNCFEIIIINDGSVDHSEILVEKFIDENPEMNIILINQSNKGVSAARNAGLKIAKGEYIALLDADDEWLPQKTERQLKYLKDKKLEVDFVSCRINHQNLFFPYISKNNLAKVSLSKLLIRSGIASPTVMFKKHVVSRTGLFDESQKYAEDHNYWLKVSFHHNMFILNEVLVLAGNGKRTFGVSGLSANLKEMKRGFMKNLFDVYNANKINFFTYYLLMFFYELKYILLISRQFYYKKIK